MLWLVPRCLFRRCKVFRREQDGIAQPGSVWFPPGTSRCRSFVFPLLSHLPVLTSSFFVVRMLSYWLLFQPIGWASWLCSLQVPYVSGLGKVTPPPPHLFKEPERLHNLFSCGSMLTTLHPSTLQSSCFYHMVGQAHFKAVSDPLDSGSYCPHLWVRIPL